MPLYANLQKISKHFSIIIGKRALFLVFMNKILVFGAGKSSSFLIQYIANHAVEMNAVLQIADQTITHLQAKYSRNTNVELFDVDVLQDINTRHQLIQNATIVLSLLPPFLHIEVAKDCILFSKNLITASYVSPAIQELHEVAKEKNILFMCEMGLDPGIDHMSAMKIIHEIQNDNGKIIEFKSHCGGLVAPESDTNPWHYKISWNPRNVITAGAAGAHYLENNEEKHIAYPQMFSTGGQINVDTIGTLAYYPNRDSLSYKNLYALADVKTLMRTTLRYPAYINAWHYMVQLGLTAETPATYDTTNLTYRQWLQQTLQSADVNALLKTTFNNDEKSLELFNYLQLQTEETINIGNNKSNADILQHAIESKWKLQPTDKDMIVMQHEFLFKKNAKQHKLISTLIVKGEDNIYTSMAKTVGLPMAILAKLLVTKKITGLSGVQIPTNPIVYNLVLAELDNMGIQFTEETKTM